MNDKPGYGVATVGERICQDSTAQNYTAVLSMKKVKCPKCGSTIFYRRMTEPVELRIRKVGFQSVVIDASCDAQPDYWCFSCGRDLEGNDIPSTKSA